MADRTLIPADAEVWRRTGQAVPACTADACRQGLAPCPCPQACRRPETAGGGLNWTAILLWTGYATIVGSGVAWGLSHLIPMLKSITT